MAVMGAQLRGGKKKVKSDGQGSQRRDRLIDVVSFSPAGFVRSSSPSSETATARWHVVIWRHQQRTRKNKADFRHVTLGSM